MRDATTSSLTSTSGENGVDVFLQPLAVRLPTYADGSDDQPAGAPFSDFHLQRPSQCAPRVSRP